MTDPIVKTYIGTIGDTRTDVPDPIVDDPGSYRDFQFRPEGDLNSGLIEFNLSALRDDLIGVKTGDTVSIVMTITPAE